MKEEIKEEVNINSTGDKNVTIHGSSADGSEVSVKSLANAVGKLPRNGNPVVSHKFGADPYALVYKNRVYLYNTHDVMEYDSEGNVKDNTYGTINTLSIISSSDLINWTDHGAIKAAGENGAAKWATQSWAPAAAHKKVNGKDVFFLYFANNASGIGVLTSDSPTGPWVDPIGKPLISRDMPAAAGVTWLFDPAVLVDDDGTGYLYYGGGLPEGQHEMPNTARVIQLGEDMISVVGEAKVIPAPYMFEDAGIHKYNGVYYYTYCSNFYQGVREEGSPPAGEIAYMTSTHPMGPWTYQGTILKNPGHFFGVSGNNHHAIFSFHDKWYIAYHAQTLAAAMGVTKGYRSTHLNKVSFDQNGYIHDITADLKGVEPIKTLDPFERVDAVTMAWSAGISVQPFSMNDGDIIANKLVISNIHDGDWIAVANVDFDGGASSCTTWVAGFSAGEIEIRLDDANGEILGTLVVPQNAVLDHWTEISTEISDINGVHDIYFVFRGEPDKEMFQLGAWQFIR